MIVLDTNVVAELMRPKPSPQVVAWADGLDPEAVIAATVLAHGKSLATRNLADFADLGLQLINPWEN